MFFEGILIFITVWVLFIICCIEPLLLAGMDGKNYFVSKSC